MINVLTLEAYCRWMSEPPPFAQLESFYCSSWIVTPLWVSDCHDYGHDTRRRESRQHAAFCHACLSCQAFPVEPSICHVLLHTRAPGHVPLSRWLTRRRAVWDWDAFLIWLAFRCPLIARIIHVDRQAGMCTLETSRALEWIGCNERQLRALIDFADCRCSQPLPHWSCRIGRLLAVCLFCFQRISCVPTYSFWHRILWLGKPENVCESCKLTNCSENLVERCFAWCAAHGSALLVYC